MPWFTEIGKKFGKPIMIMETAYNWNPTLPDGSPGQLKDTGPAPYPASPQGQKDFMLNLFNAIRKEEGNYILGSLYWDPIMIEQEGVGWAMIAEDKEKGRVQQVAANVVANTTLFNFDGKALPILNAYREENKGEYRGECEI